VAPGASRPLSRLVHPFQQLTAVRLDAIEPILDRDAVFIDLLLVLFEQLCPNIFGDGSR
jgi:hypothetical protein